MRPERRILLLRIFSILALAASGVLMGDALHPDRGFCPLDAACAAAAGSPLGSVRGVPTSALGAAAFGVFLMLTFLPTAWARRVLRPAGLAAATFGVVFIGYQLIALRGVCPFCVVADLAGIGAGAVVATWRAPKGRWKGPPPEELPVRLRWMLVAALALALPLLWPRPEPRPSWVPLPPGLGDETPGVASAGDALPPPLPAPRPPPSPPGPTSEPFGGPPAERAPVEPPDPGAVAASGARGGVEPDPAPPPVPSEPPPPPRRELTVVEYLNPYCGHCRATHARLDRVLAAYPVPVRIVRVYVWSTAEPPLWAHACACAAAQGREAELFAELLRAPDESAASIWAAARRAGLDVEALAACASRGDATPRLAAERHRVQASRLEGLPTFDVGRRRLQGEQSEPELRDALDAADALVRAGGGGRAGRG